VSHIVQIQTQVKDAAAVRAGCHRLQLDAPVEGEVKLFSETVSGLAVRLREWRYPVVFNLATGESKFDNELNELRSTNCVLCGGQAREDLALLLRCFGLTDG
jgi:hypothetical protein